MFTGITYYGSGGINAKTLKCGFITVLFCVFANTPLDYINTKSKLIEIPRTTMLNQVCLICPCKFYTHMLKQSI